MKMTTTMIPVKYGTDSEPRNNNIYYDIKIGIENWLCIYLPSTISRLPSVVGKTGTVVVESLLVQVSVFVSVIVYIIYYYMMCKCVHA